MTNASVSRINSITSWRGIFAVSVVLFHCKVKWLMEMATGGVVFFFIVSGFLLAMRHRPEQAERLAFKSFFKRRALRLYPLHWLAFTLLMAITLAFSVPTTRMSWVALLPNLLLLQSFVPDVDVFFSFNTPSWFLCSLMFCYLCYPFVVVWLNKLRLRHQILLFALLMLIYYVCISFVTSTDVVTFTHVCPLLRLYEFSMGITLYNVYKAIAPRIQGWGFAKASVAEVLTFGLLLGLIVFSQTWDYQYKDNYNDSLMWEVPMSLLVLVSALNAGREGVIGRILCCKPLMWVGGVSLEIFLLHFVAGLVFVYLFCPFFGHFGMLLYDYYAVGQLPILFAMGWAMHRWYTRPVFAWASRHSS